MSGANHACLNVREKDRRAIGRENSEEQTGSASHHPIGVRPLLTRPCILDCNGISRMDLVDRHQIRARLDRIDRALPVLVDRSPIVIAAVTDVEARERTRRNAAAAPKESVREIAEAYRAVDLDALIAWAHSTFFMTMSSSAWLPTMKS